MVEITQPIRARAGTWIIFLEASLELALIIAYHIYHYVTGKWRLILSYSTQARKKFFFHSILFL